MCQKNILLQFSGMKKSQARTPQEAGSKQASPSDRILGPFIYIFLCSLFNDDASNSNFIALNDWIPVNNDLEHLWKEAFMVHFKELKDIYQT
jgi:hypothetical protein